MAQGCGTREHEESVARVVGDRGSMMGVAQVKEALGWEPKVPLREGLARMVDDFTKRCGAVLLAALRSCCVHAVLSPQRKCSSITIVCL